MAFADDFKLCRFFIAQLDDLPSDLLQRIYIIIIDHRPVGAIWEGRRGRVQACYVYFIRYTREDLLVNKQSLSGEPWQVMGGPTYGCK